MKKVYLSSRVCLLYMGIKLPHPNATSLQHFYDNPHDSYTPLNNPYSYNTLHNRYPATHHFSTTQPSY